MLRTPKAPKKLEKNCERSLRPKVNGEELRKNNDFFLKFQINERFT